MSKIIHHQTYTQVKSVDEISRERLLEKYNHIANKYNSLLNKRDSILQAIYNDMMYGQPVKYSLRVELLQHCNERGLELPKGIDIE